jgi:heme oxygenase
LIIVRLPLALAPHASDASLYVTGLLHIAPIYITFEAIWQKITATNSKQEPFENFAEWRKPCDRIKSILFKLFLPELVRSERLRSDISLLSGKSSQGIYESIAHVSQTSPVLASFVEHMEVSVIENPHVLVAYAWVLYMALFSGGRYLRASVRNGGTDDFWLRSSLSQPPSANQAPQIVINPFAAEEKNLLPRLSPPRLAPLDPEPLLKARVATVHQFFNFPGVEDGEDIRKEFKSRFAEMEMILSDREKEEIVEEAQHIFNFMVGVVGDLDTVCNTKLEQGKAERSEGHVVGRLESIPGVSTFARGWMSMAWTGRQGDMTRSLVLRATSRMLNLGLETLWPCLLLLLLSVAVGGERD